MAPSEGNSGARPALSAGDGFQPGRPTASSAAARDATARASPLGATANGVPRHATAATAAQLSVAPSTVTGSCACIGKRHHPFGKIKQIIIQNGSGLLYTASRFPGLLVGARPRLLVRRQFPIKLVRIVDKPPGAEKC
jgi:hypothetical protein